MSPNLAMIGTPGHYYNLLECMAQLGIEQKNTSLILFNFDNDTHTNGFFDTYIVKKNWKKVEKISVWNSNDPTATRVSDLYISIKFAVQLLRITAAYFENVIVNQVDVRYYHLFFSLIRYKTLFAMDEGNAIIRLIEQRYDSSIKKTWLPIPSAITFFSSYDIAVQAPDAVVKCENVYSKRIAAQKTINPNEVIVIGGDYVEVDIIDASRYHQVYLPALRARHADKKVIYIAHRRETAANLAIIASLGFITLSLNEPIELYLVHKNELPATITGYYSAAILNLKNILPTNIVFEAHRLAGKDVRRISAETLATIYQQFADFGIIII
jgi:hypothetical protein